MQKVGRWKVRNKNMWSFRDSLPRGQDRSPLSRVLVLAMVRCSKCKLNLMDDDFSVAQMRKKSNQRKCKRCVGGVPAIPIAPAPLPLPEADPDAATAATAVQPELQAAAEAGIAAIDEALPEPSQPQSQESMDCLSQLPTTPPEVEEDHDAPQQPEPESSAVAEASGAAGSVAAPHAIADGVAGGLLPACDVCAAPAPPGTSQPASAANAVPRTAIESIKLAEMYVESFDAMVEEIYGACDDIMRWGAAVAASADLAGLRICKSWQPFDEEDKLRALWFEIFDLLCEEGGRGGKRIGLGAVAMRGSEARELDAECRATAARGEANTSVYRSMLAQKSRLEGLVHRAMTGEYGRQSAALLQKGRACLDAAALSIMARTGCPQCTPRQCYIRRNNRLRATRCPSGNLPYCTDYLDLERAKTTPVQGLERANNALCSLRQRRAYYGTPDGSVPLNFQHPGLDRVQVTGKRVGSVEDVKWDAASRAVGNDTSGHRAEDVASQALRREYQMDADVALLQQKLQALRTLSEQVSGGAARTDEPGNGSAGSRDGSVDHAQEGLAAEQASTPPRGLVRKRGSQLYSGATPSSLRQPSARSRVLDAALEDDQALPAGPLIGRPFRQPGSSKVHQ